MLKHTAAGGGGGGGGGGVENRCSEIASNAIFGLKQPLE